MEYKNIFNNKEIKVSIIERIAFFLRGAQYSYKALFAWLVPQVYILTKIVSPMFQILFFTYLGRFYARDLQSTYFVVGNAVQISALSSIYGIAMTIASERTEGTLIQLLGTPASRIRIFISRGLMHILDGFFSIAIGFTFGFIFLGINFENTNFFLLILTLFITIFSTSGLGMVIGSMGLAMREINLLSNLAYSLLLVFCGINYPLSRLPLILRGISYSLPLTRGVQAIRIIIGGGVFSDISSLILEELCIGFLYLTIGFIFFRFLEIYSKKNGTLEMY
ncbi:ABC transporter permease [Paramaledivibacter caminithermalis]|jgi:ABC-2 type transport system permease protein|uniref:Transport permease protein n=1 Tax=Paramaledivibacter caminithermalis (strain DSM 15212 / CIP 107654 / DViRD3) TaxID=1121301 RepID=A0A1M6QGD9_PARC5|nr:ABC transporter permease [Paramaledivibacter caminithermalis]SHK19286.1 ABC-2 type transport system permease protein [Paramaledivibacter caminithermalis DSM 15212]